MNVKAQAAGRDVGRPGCARDGVSRRDRALPLVWGGLLRSWVTLASLGSVNHTCCQMEMSWTLHCQSIIGDGLVPFFISPASDMF